jgi:hypothetical protein
VSYPLGQVPHSAEEDKLSATLEILAKRQSSVISPGLMEWLKLKTQHRKKKKKI